MTISALGQSVGDDYGPVEAAAIGRKLFGEHFNLFMQGGMWYAGRFLDGGVYKRGERQGKEVLPWHRKQEIFGSGRTLREALRFAVGRTRVYSGPGMSPGGLAVGTGMTPLYDKHGRMTGWQTPAGVFSKAFPSSTVVTA